MLDMHRKAKNAVRKIALYNKGSCNLSQALEILTRVSRSKGTPRNGVEG